MIGMGAGAGEGFAFAHVQGIDGVAEGVNLAEWRLDYKSGKMVRLIPAKAEGA